MMILGGRKEKRVIIGCVIFCLVLLASSTIALYFKCSDLQELTTNQALTIEELEEVARIQGTMIRDAKVNQ